MICGKTFGKRQLERTRNTREVDGLGSTECLLTIFDSSCQRVRNIIWRHYDHFDIYMSKRDYIIL
jgi:hypothetical protein